MNHTVCAERPLSLAELATETSDRQTWRLVVLLGLLAGCTATAPEVGGAGGSGGSGGGQPAATGGSGGAPPGSAGSGGAGGAGSGGAGGAGGMATSMPKPPDARTSDRPATPPDRPDAASMVSGPRDGGAGDAPAPDAGVAVVRAIPPTGFTCPGGPFGDPLPATRTATLIKANAGSLEGPVWVAEQNALFFCVVAPVARMGRIDKYVPATNMFSTFASGIDVAGLAIGREGDIVAASFDSRNLTRFDLANARRTSIPGSDSYMNRPFNQTNDLVIRSDGNIYFTDTDYRQDGRAGQDTTAYYRFSPAGEVTRLGRGPEPNGIALSPDGQFLYVSSTGGDPVRRLVLDESGAAVGAPTTFTSASSDGMAVDCAGNVYLSTAGTIRVLAPDGRVLGAITGLGTSTVSNAAFGGPDRKTLFITTASALYQIQMNVPGFPN